MEEMGNSFDDFPILTQKDLYFIACGSYQMKEAPSYNDDNVKRDGAIEIQLCRHTEPLNFAAHNIFVSDPLFIRGRIYSRFSNSAKYLLYILIDIVEIGS